MLRTELLAMWSERSAFMSRRNSKMPATDKGVGLDELLGPSLWCSLGTEQSASERSSLFGAMPGGVSFSPPPPEMVLKG